MEQHTPGQRAKRPRPWRPRVRKSTWTERLWFFVVVAALSSVIPATTTGIWGSVVPSDDVVIAGTNNPRVRARLLIHEGQRLLQTGRPDEGLACFRRGLDLALRHRLRGLTGSGLLNIGLVFRYLDQPDSALRYLGKAQEVFARSGNPRAAAVAAEHLKSVRRALESEDR